MTLDQASAAAGKPIRLNPSRPVRARVPVPLPVRRPDDLAFMLIDGRIARVDVGHKGPDWIKTVSGIGKGGTKARVQRAYPGRLGVQEQRLGGDQLPVGPEEPSRTDRGLLLRAAVAGP